LLVITLFGLACSGFCCMSRRGHSYTRVSSSSDWVSHWSLYKAIFSLIIFATS
jgi:hypothetical protein